MSSWIGARDIWAGARLWVQLPSLLRHPISAERASAILRRRLARRAEDFLEIARKAIYPRRESAHRRLLVLSGCEFGDLEQLVRADGLEGALTALYRRGVYLTIDELKGRRPVVRGSETFWVDLHSLRSAAGGGGWTTRTGGSGGTPVPVDVGLPYIRSRAVATRLVFEALDALGWSHAIWGLPGGAASLRVLDFCGGGSPPVRWFSPLDPRTAGVHPRYRWSTWALRLAARAASVRVPAPEFVPLEHPEPISEWMAGVLREGGTPHLHTTSSNSVRVAQSALRRGLNITGAKFTMASEPTTPARRAAVERSGADAMALFVAIETGPIGYGCLGGEAVDDVHLLHDSHAVIQPGPAKGPLPQTALLLTSLRSAAPLVLLNVSLGDCAEMVPRSCGCALERIGWTEHLHSVRSHEKLTAGGMTFLDTDVARVLEEVLPLRFGGGPTDYQLVEDDSEDGLPRVSLLVHPAVGEVDSRALADAFLDEIGRGSTTERVMAIQWREAGLPHTERRAPQPTPDGKFLHLRREAAAWRG